jgi:ATP-dependent DNA ligase
VVPSGRKRMRSSRCSPKVRAPSDKAASAGDEQGVTSFGALQDALSRRAQDKLAYYLFDVLHLNGEDVRGKTLLERKELLRKVVPRDHAPL